VDIVLVGDSLGMWQAAPDLAVTLDEMVYHSRAAARGVSSAHLVVDMPFMSYQPVWKMECGGGSFDEGRRRPCGETGMRREAAS